MALEYQHTCKKRNPDSATAGLAQVQAAECLIDNIGQVGIVTFVRSALTHRMMDRGISDAGRHVGGSRVVRVGGCTVIAIIRECLVSSYIVEVAVRGIDTGRALKERHTVTVLID